LQGQRDQAKRKSNEVNGEVKSQWTVSTCGGVDLISKPLLVSSDSKNVVVNAGDRVLVYNSSSGAIVRTINTGPLLNICDTGDPNTVLVATKRKIMLWDISKVKIIKKINIFPDGGSNKHYKRDDILDIFLATNALKVNEIYLVAKAKKELNALYRVNLSDHDSNVVKILRHVTVGSVHIGDNNNTLVAITNNKAHGYVNSTLECYDRNLKKVQNFNTDKERPFTVARVHPREKLVAAGDTSGRIFVLTGLGDQLSPARSVLHWHSLPVTALSWSLEGGFLYSGAAERVLVKWRINDNARPSFLPRLAGGLVGVTAGLGVTTVQLDDNSVVILNNQDRPRAQLTGLTRSKSVWPAGLTWDSRAQAVVMNGRVGQLQVFKPDVGECVASIDITQQNYVAKERNVNPLNSEVELVAISSCGTHMATLDCCWTVVPKITLKFWNFNHTSQKFCLNTQVDRPHIDGVISLSFRPGLKKIELLSCGKDGRVKVWQLSSCTGSWNCSSCLTFRGMSTGAAGWSHDGTVVAVAFQHITTLWDQECRLRTSLADGGSEDPVVSLQFGRHSSSRLLMTATPSTLITWDLLTLSPTWRLPLTTSPSPTALHPCPSSSRLAVIHKDLLLVLDPSTQTVLASLPSVNCTGAAVFAPNAAFTPNDPSQPRTCLYFINYSGVMKRVGPKLAVKRRKTPLVEQASVLKTLIKGKDTERKVESWDKAGRNDDLEAFLSLPVNAVPAPSVLQNMMMKNRLLALPKLRKLGKIGQVQFEENDRNSKKVERYKDIFKFNEPSSESVTDLKSFIKRLKIDAT